VTVASESDPVVLCFISRDTDSSAVPTGRVKQLLRAANDVDDGVSTKEIARMINTDELPVNLSTTTNISIGDN
jgi:hypothetical protein